MDSHEATLWAELAPVYEAEVGFTFDELISVAVEQPDNELALSGLKQLIGDVYDNGYIGLSMQMAMNVGAVACAHSHLQELASEISSMFDAATNEHDGTDATEHDHDQPHDGQTCKECLNGRLCLQR